MQHWPRIGVDTGGTFTDVVLAPAAGAALITYKLPSTPDDPAEAVLRGVREVLAEARRAGYTIEGDDLQVIHGSTVATNALLESRTGRTAFITTAGFEDVPWIARQNRPELYSLSPRKPRPPLSRELVFGIVERMRYDGSVLQQLDDSEVRRVINLLRQSAVPSAAICLLHSYANPAHEEMLAAAIRAELPGLLLTVSSELLPEFREYERASACIANAAVAPRMSEYIGRLERELAPAALRIMASSGGSRQPQQILRRPIDTALSGPAGGLLGAWHSAQQAGIDRIIAFDMGGTSTDVSLCSGGLPQTALAELNGLPLRIPMVDIHSVGAGGGSLVWLDSGGALRVGPRSMGAEPGPACYGQQRGSLQPTITDAHVVLGTLPHGSQLSGGLRLDGELSQRAFEEIAQRLGLTVEETALGALKVADAEMARALRLISVERGHDPRDFTLLSFGGAGGLHAVRLAETLGMRRVLVPRHGGLLSALGMLASQPLHSFSRSLLLRVAHPSTGIYVNPQDIAQVRTALEEMQGEAAERLSEDAVSLAERQFEVKLELRYLGQSHEISVALSSNSFADFEREHRRLYGYALEDRPLELICLRLFAGSKDYATEASEMVKMRMGSAEFNALPRQPAYTERGWSELRLLSREELFAGDQLLGPLLVQEYGSTIHVPEGWQLSVNAAGQLLLEKEVGQDMQHESQTASTLTESASAIELEIFRSLFSSIAEEMGMRLLRSAFSPNIKERRDFSCALFAAGGELIAQAAHIPVHLGSMPLSLQAVLEVFPAHSMQPGQHYVLNDPYSGGTHLPDITILAPVFLPGEDSPRFFVANRAHHADIGGSAPGSLALVESIEDEGLRIEPMLLTEAVLEWICSASRTPEERRGDLRAQLASLQIGAERLADLSHKYGAGLVEQRAEDLLDYSQRIMRKVIGALPDGDYSFSDQLDDDGLGTRDIRISCDLSIRGNRLIADFTRSSEQVRGPLNAVRAITLSAVNYCLRCLAPPEMPSNGGVMRGVVVLTQPGSVVDARYPAPVVGGNVETSQRIVDCVFGALSGAAPGVIPAASSGSMNNLAIGGIDPRHGQPFAYYETIGGGSGGGPGFQGEHAVHTHMTNTLNTPVEALEHACPLRIERYAIRRNSGGEGRYSGGDGIVRRYAFEAEVEATLLTERRRSHPYGLAGGEPGSAGRNTLFEADGSSWDLGGKEQLLLRPGQVLEIETPGGGGFGAHGEAEDQ